MSACGSSSRCDWAQNSMHSNAPFALVQNCYTRKAFWTVLISQGVQILTTTCLFRNLQGNIGLTSKQTLGASNNNLKKLWVLRNWHMSQFVPAKITICKIHWVSACDRFCSNLAGTSQTNLDWLVHKAPHLRELFVSYWHVLVFICVLGYSFFRLIFLPPLFSGM